MRILYQPDDGPVSVMIPVIPQYTIDGVEAEEQLDVIQIGTKDVPAGLPFWVVEDSEVPSDRSMRDAWVLDASAMGAPAGTGERA